MCKFTKLSPYLYSLDIFKSPVPLLFSGHSRISTISGLFCTLAITITLLLITFQSDLLQKKTPKILSIDIPQQYRKNVDFTGRLLAVGLQDELDGSGFWDPQVFNINVSLAMIEGANLIEREIKVKRCEKEDFKNFWNENLYTELNLKDNFCVDRKEEIELGGYWDEGTVKYLKIELKICDNATETGGCKGYDEIKQVFLRNNSFNIYFENAIIDINSYDNSVQKTVQNEYKSIDMNFKKIIEVSFKNIEINTDQGFVLEENHSDKGVKYDEEKFDFYYRSEIGADKTLFRYEFFASKNTLSIVRKYEKISDLLGKLCGVLKALTVLGFIITKIELNLGMKKKIIGLLFDFKHTELNEKKNS